MVERLGEVLEKLDSAASAAVKNCRLLLLWDRVADERMRKNTEAVKIRNHVLYVSTSSSAWAQELSFLKREIIAKFNQVAGGEAIKDIHFRANGGS